MARPKTALISPQAVVAQATQILEQEGLEGLSVRALAARLNVNSASLYHHFTNKDEILSAVMRAALRDVVLPPLSDMWDVWIAENAVAYRRLLVARPFIIPLLLRGIRPHTMAYAVADAKLSEAGVPETARPEFLLVLDTTVIGSALVSITLKGLPRGARAGAQFDHEAMLRSTIKLLLQDMIAQHRTAERGPRRAARAID